MQRRKSYLKRGTYKRKKGGGSSAFHLRGKTKYARGGIAAHAVAMDMVLPLIKSGLIARIFGGQR